MTADRPIGAQDPGVIEFFAESLPVVRRFHELLVADGVVRGLIGPREVERLWDRHLINSGAVARLVPAQGTLVDVGSGGGFPGIVLAAMRPGVRVLLVEPMERRTNWLSEVAAELGLGNVEVVRGRAEDLLGTVRADLVTARAVAPLDRLSGWTLPLLRAEGELLALKGQRAAEELREARATIESWGGGRGEVVSVETVPGLPAVTVVRVVRVRETSPPRRHSRRR